MLTFTACSKYRTQTIMSFQIYGQKCNGSAICFCLSVSVNLNLKSLSTRSYVWRRFFPLNIQPKLRQRRPMSGSKSSKSSISPLLSSRIYSNHTGESPCSGPPVSVHPGLQNENNGETCLALSLLSGSNSQFCQNRSKVLSCCSPHNLKTQNVQQ